MWKMRRSHKSRSVSIVSVYLFGSLPAVDLFFISVPNDTHSLCATRDFYDYEIIETLTVDHQNLTIEMLVVLASTVSAHCPTYNLYRKQCYWYAGVVWAITSELAYPGRAPAGLGASKKKGKNTLLPFFTVALPVDEEDKPQALCVKYDKDWEEFCRVVEPLRGVSRFFLTWYILTKFGTEWAG
jgi:hypothetical protein